MHVDAEAAADHAARVADAAGVVERIADRQRMQHGAAGARRMAAAGGKNPRDVAVRHRRAGDIDRGGHELAAGSPGRHRDDHGFELQLGGALGEIDGLADRGFGGGEIDHRAGLHAACAGMAEADHLDRVAAAAQRLPRADWA